MVVWKNVLCRKCLLKYYECMANPITDFTFQMFFHMCCKFQVVFRKILQGSFYRCALVHHALGGYSGTSDMGLHPPFTP